MQEILWLPDIACFQSFVHFGTRTLDVSSGLSAYKSPASNGFRIPIAQILLNHHIVCLLINDEKFSSDLF